MYIDGREPPNTNYAHTEYLHLRFKHNRFLGRDKFTFRMHKVGPTPQRTNLVGVVGCLQANRAMQHASCQSLLIQYTDTNHPMVETGVNPPTLYIVSLTYILIIKVVLLNKTNASKLIKLVSLFPTFFLCHSVSRSWDLGGELRKYVFMLALND